MKNLVRKCIPARYRAMRYLTELALRRSECYVINGPFKGMRHVGRSVGSVLIPKIIGIYERELWGCIETVCSSPPDLVVDVGAAEGYYAVGLALRCPQARVVAFEMEAAGRAALSEMVKLNGSDGRVEIRGKCEAEDLQAALVGARRPVVVCDTEGYEQILLDPVAVPGLNKAAILAEMHDFIAAGVTDSLIRRFAASHRTTRIWQEPRERREFPWRTWYARALPGRYIDWAVGEHRPERMSWLWMEPK